MGRAPCCDKSSVKKGPWSPDEDAKLKSYIHQNGTGGNWIALPQKIGLKRCGKSCRLRWLNYLRPNIKHGGFSEEEDNLICSLYITIGSRWSIIAAQLPGRTDNDIKNYWNTRLKKKLLGKHRKEKRGKLQGSAKPYSAEAPVLPPIPYSNGEPRFNDYASIRNLLIRLGGSFDTHQPLYTPIDHLPSLHTTPSALDPAHPLNLPDFDFEPPALMHHNSQGLDFFYDQFINTATSMDIMNSSIFPNNQGSMMMMHEEFCVDKMRYPGIQ